jgi:hypothetical protein
MSLHQDTGKCSWCQHILDRYKNFHPQLRAWFEDVQAQVPDAHISCAGRGRQDQEMDFHRRVSKAHYGQSSHNYNAAIDLFKSAPTVTEMYDKVWFRTQIAPKLSGDLEWYGAPGAEFYELPHIEVRGWKDMAQRGELLLVE